MKIPVITEGATTSHGGKITECESSFAIHGKGIHLEGMSYYCPKCKCTVNAVVSNHTKTVFGKSMILQGDMTTCGAKFISAQSVTFVGGSSSSDESAVAHLWHLHL